MILFRKAFFIDSLSFSCTSILILFIVIILSLNTVAEHTNTTNSSILCPDPSENARFRGYKTLWKVLSTSKTPTVRNTRRNEFQMKSFTWWKRSAPNMKANDIENRNYFSPLRRTTRVTWDGPSEWETPEYGRFMLWKWTTTLAAFTMPFRNNFYDFLMDHITSVGGRTTHFAPLPTLRPVSGTTIIWRLWSYNQQRSRIDTYLALETEGRPRSVKPTTLFPDRRRKFRHICYTGTGGKNGTRWYGPVLATRIMRGGCFKRFTDVGHVYVERGCRTWPPTKGLSFASKSRTTLGHRWLVDEILQLIGERPRAIDESTSSSLVFNWTPHDESLHRFNFLLFPRDMTKEFQVP